MDDEFLYLSMEKYIEQALDALGLADIRPVKSPINAPIEGGSPLDHSLRRKFMMAVGCIGWLVNTGRPDIAYAHSRVAQHMASPTTSAMDAVKRIMAYLKGAKDWCLGVPLTSPNGGVSTGSDSMGVVSSLTDTKATHMPSHSKGSSTYKTESHLI